MSLAQAMPDLPWCWRRATIFRRQRGSMRLVWRSRRAWLPRSAMTPRFSSILQSITESLQKFIICSVTPGRRFLSCGRGERLCSRCSIRRRQCNWVSATLRSLKAAYPPWKGAPRLDHHPDGFAGTGERCLALAHADDVTASVPEDRDPRPGNVARARRPRHEAFARNKAGRSCNHGDGQKGWLKVGGRNGGMAASP